MNIFQIMQISSLVFSVINIIESERAGATGKQKRAAAIALVMESSILAAELTNMTPKEKTALKRELGKIIDGTVGVLNLTVWKQ